MQVCLCRSLATLDHCTFPSKFYFQITIFRINICGTTFVNDDKKRLLFLVIVTLLEMKFFVSLNQFIIEKKCQFLLENHQLKSFKLLLQRNCVLLSIPLAPDLCAQNTCFISPFHKLSVCCSKCNANHFLMVTLTRQEMLLLEL